MIGSLKEIRLFVAAYEERSFTAAAAREGATQSGVSQHIRRLEDRLGVALFERDKGGIIPCPAADRYYDGCIEILRAHIRAADSVRPFARGSSGQLRVGLMPTMAQSILRLALLDFLPEFPNVTIEVVDGYSHALSRMVQANELDFAIVPAAPAALGVRSRSFQTVPEVLVSGPDAPWPHGVPLRLRDLPALKFVGLRPSNIRRQNLDAYFEQSGIRLEKVIALDSVLGTVDLVATSDWVTIWPAIAVPFSREAGRLTINPLIDPAMDSPLVLIEPARRPLSRPGEVFLDALHKATKRIAAPWRLVRDGMPLDSPELDAPELDTPGPGTPAPITPVDDLPPFS
jgi:LysR family transcriptional regulator, nitrogen assimilation regulatory protein